LFAGAASGVNNVLVVLVVQRLWWARKNRIRRQQKQNREA
jgi:hypothetical protein